MHHGYYIPEPAELDVWYHLDHPRNLLFGVLLGVFPISNGQIIDSSSRKDDDNGAHERHDNAQEYEGHRRGEEEGGGGG